MAEINRELLLIQKYTVLKQIIEQWNRTTFKSLLNRIATEEGVQLNCNISFVARYKKIQTEKEQENETTPDETDKENPSTISKKAGNKKKKGGILSDQPLTSISTRETNFEEIMICETEAEEQVPPTSSIQVEPNTAKSEKVLPIVISEHTSSMVSRELVL